MTKLDIDLSTWLNYLTVAGLDWIRLRFAETCSLQLFFTLFIIYFFFQTIFKMASASKQGRDKKVTQKSVLKLEKKSLM